MIYKISQPNIFCGHLMPPEDSLLENGRIFCVADGVTLEPISPKNFDRKNALIKYPNPSRARIVADIFCELFIKYLRNKKPTEKNIATAFNLGNEAIGRFNKKQVKKINYLEHDLFACVASGGIITKNKLYWGNICDCGIIVFDKNGRIKFQTPNEMKLFEKYEKRYLKKPNFDFTKPKYRIMIRSKHRNKAKIMAKGLANSYGVLNGEIEAKQFMNFGTVKLNKSDLIVLYTDGFENTILNKKIFKALYQKTDSLISQAFIPYDLKLAKKNHYKFGRERTLIAFKNN